MQYVWQHRLWLPTDMNTVDGERVEVLDPGLPNVNAGPDFFNAKIRIGSRLWAGNVEIHVKASDWHRHGHDGDPAYHSVILHVVERDDARIQRPDGSEVPQLVMPCAADFSKVYHEMVDNPASELPCAEHIGRMEKIQLTDWLTALAFERLYAKADRVQELVERSGGDWKEAVYVVLARALGFGVNSDAFERLALATPLRNLLRHCGSSETIEGTLFGQAGFLDSVESDDVETASYVTRMKGEYEFTGHKYGLQKPAHLGWRMARMRPHNFAYRRLAALAQTVSDGFGIGYSILHVSNLEEARALFDIRLRGYWSRRFSFGAPSARSDTALSRASADTLVINVVAPVLVAYATAYGDERRRETATDILQSLAPEDNAITRLFTTAGVECPDALASQALVQLRKCYCQPRKCLYCRIGHRYLASKAIRRNFS